MYIINKIKIMIYHYIVESVLLYGVRSWTIQLFHGEWMSLIKQINHLSYHIGKYVIIRSRDLDNTGTILWSRNIINKTKIIIYHSVLEKVLLYEAETWTIQKQIK